MSLTPATLIALQLAAVKIQLRRLHGLRLEAIERELAGKPPADLRALATITIPPYQPSPKARP